MNTSPSLKKIVLVDNSSWNIYNFRLPLVKRLKSEGFEVIIATPVDEFIHYLNDTYYTKHIPIRHLDRKGKNPFRDLLFLRELIRIYKTEKPDMVLHFTIKANIFGSIAARICSVPAVTVVTGLGYTFLHPEKSLNQFIPRLYRFALKKVEKVIVYNQDDYKFFIERKIINEGKCSVFPGTGINTNYFRPLAKSGKQKKFVFLFIGRLLKDKGVPEFVKASRRLRECAEDMVSWVIGDLNFGNPADVRKEELVDWINNEDIIYYGSTHDVRKYIRDADVLVLPSKREGLPRVILEAMSMGKPIITTDTAGCREAVKHGENGLLVPVENADALFQAMLYMYEAKEEERVLIGKRNRLRIMRYFDEKISTDYFMRLIDDILNVEIKATAPEIDQGLPIKSDMGRLH